MTQATAKLFKPTLSRRQITYFYNRVNNALTKAGISGSEFVLDRNHKGLLNTEKSREIISKLLEEIVTPRDGLEDWFVSEDFLQYLRSATYQLRFSFQGDLRIVALLVKELLPNRQDVRDTAFRVPTGQVCNDPNFENIITAMGHEKSSYLNALIYEACQSEAYSAQMRFRQYEDALTELDQVTGVWTITPDSQENLGEILICRTLSEVDHEGIPKQLADSKSEKVQAARNIVQAMHSTARYSHLKGHPLYRFMTDLSDLLLTTATTSVIPPMADVEDAMFELSSDVVTVGEDLKISSMQAEAMLTRFHHGHPIYKDMIDHLRKQNGIVVATVNDLMRRFCVIFKELQRTGVLTGDERTKNRWSVFLTTIGAEPIYRRHQNKPRKP